MHFVQIKERERENAKDTSQLPTHANLVVRVELSSQSLFGFALLGLNPRCYRASIAMKGSSKPNHREEKREHSET